MAVVGRLAPSPTGHLHLGNAWAFLLAWLACRKMGGTMILRMEDIDPVRSTRPFADDIMRDLEWLGLDWDTGPFYQGDRSHRYEDALERLKATGRVYPCYCTRKELRTVAGAPHVDDRGAPYPGTCRHLSKEECQARETAGRRPTMRLNTEGLPCCFFDDGVCGRQELTLDSVGGDFALRRSDGVWAYQLAVTVDDGEMGVNQVVRGEDILVSTPRQLALFALLGYTPPEYAHIPLLCDEHGERLAKRHGSLSLQALRNSGVEPKRIIGMLARLAGLGEASDGATPAELTGIFDFSLLGRNPVILDTRCLGL